MSLKSPEAKFTKIPVIVDAEAINPISPFVKPKLLA